MMGQVELGLQAGVFAIFDLEAKSKDLVNADYFVAALAAYRTGNVSALARLFHQSSRWKQRSQSGQYSSDHQ